VTNVSPKTIGPSHVALPNPAAAQSDFRRGEYDCWFFALGIAAESAHRPWWLEQEQVNRRVPPCLRKTDPSFLWRVRVLEYRL